MQLWFDVDRCHARRCDVCVVAWWGVLHAVNHQRLTYVFRLMATDSTFGIDERQFPVMTGGLSMFLEVGDRPSQRASGHCAPWHAVTIVAACMLFEVRSTNGGNISFPQYPVWTCMFQSIIEGTLWCRRDGSNGSLESRGAYGCLVVYVQVYVSVRPVWFSKCSAASAASARAAVDACGLL